MDINDIKEAGFEDALTSVVETRLQRKKIYGDGWKKDPDWAILAEIRQKYLRLEKNVMSGNGKYENAIDTLIDLCCYALFMLENKLHEK